MNAEPNSETIQMLKTCWDILSVEGNTYSSHNPDKCIDFILQLKNGVKCEVIESKVPTVFHTGDVTQASDHLPIYVDVKIPKNYIPLLNKRSPRHGAVGERRFSPANR